MGLPQAVKVFGLEPSPHHYTRFAVVRCGDVMGSIGWVITFPTFIQVHGALTITSEYPTYFKMLPMIRDQSRPGSESGTAGGFSPVCWTRDNSTESMTPEDLRK